MEKPAMITITDDKGEIVYMQFVDMRHIDSYKDGLDKMSEDYVEFIDKNGDSYFSMTEFVSKLIEDR